MKPLVAKIFGISLLLATGATSAMSERPRDTRPLVCDADCSRCQRGCAMRGVDCRASCVEHERACCYAAGRQTAAGRACNCE